MVNLSLLPETYYNAYNTMDNVKSRTFVFNTVLRFERFIKKKFKDWILSDFLDTQKIFNDIDNLKLTQQIHFLGVIKRYIVFKGKINSVIFDKYKKRINELYDILNSKNAKNKKTDRDKQNFISYNELRDKFIKHIPCIEKQKYTKFRNYLITGFYVLQSPVRLCNLQNLIYIKPDTKLLKNIENKTQNYITKINNKWHIEYNNYKTVKHLGYLNFEIKDSNLIKLLDMYIDKFNIPVNQQFFYNNLDFKEKPLCGVTIGTAIRKIIKIITGVSDVSLNVLRHSCITEFYSQNRSIEEKKQLALEMGQLYKINMADYYIKLD